MHGPEPAQLGRLFDSFAAALVLYARQWLDRASAEDVVQDAFLSLMAAGGRPTDAKAWLFRAVRNAALNRLRAERRRGRHEGEFKKSRADWFDPGSSDLLAPAIVQTALSSLPIEQREVIVLRIWAQMTLNQIGELLDEPISTLGSRYQAGLAALRRMLEASCHTKTT
jgi:RNA polymerase sigma factor (sigma-70 family)